MPILSSVEIPTRIPFKTFEQILIETAKLMGTTWEKIADDVLLGLEQHGVTVEDPEEGPEISAGVEKQETKPKDEAPLGSDKERMSNLADETIEQLSKTSNRRKTSTTH